MCPLSRLRSMVKTKWGEVKTVEVQEIPKMLATL